MIKIYVNRYGKLIYTWYDGVDRGVVMATYNHEADPSCKGTQGAVIAAGISWWARSCYEVVDREREKGFE